MLDEEPKDDRETQQKQRSKMFNINAQKYSSRADFKSDSSTCKRHHDILQREMY
jgi:hypothetical protein